MATPVQITVTVDSNGAVTGFQQIGGAATTMGQQISISGLKGADAVAALTKQWEAEQAAIAAVNARIKENMAAQAASTAAVDKVSKAFQGFTSEQMKASIAGRILEQQLGINNRGMLALNQVMSRSALLGPILAASLSGAVFVGASQAIIRIGEEIASAAQAAGGMTEEVKRMNAELAQSNQQAFLNPKNLSDTLSHLADVNAQSITAEKESRKTWGEKVAAIQDSTTLLGKAVGLDGLMVIYELTHNTAVQKGMELDKERNTLMERYAELVKQAGVDQAMISATSSGLHGFAKLKFDEAVAIDALEKDKSLDAISRANKEYAVHYEFSQRRIQLEQQESDKVISLRHSVTDETLTGINKIYADETFAVDQATKLQQRNGTSYQDLEQTKVLLHQKALNEIAAYDRQQQEATLALQNEALLSGLDGDAKIIASAEQRANKERSLYARGVVDYDTMAARIVALDKVRNDQIDASDEAEAEKERQRVQKLTALHDRASEDMKVAQEDAALATVPLWQRASASIQIELNRRLRAIEDERIKQIASDQLGADAIVAINQEAEAKRYDAIVTTNLRIREEQRRLVESLGSDLQSVFDDITSGNIGKRILSNMEKLFFQILAQWILSLNMMKSAAGSIFGSIVFGPGSTGAGVFGGGGQQGGGGSSLLGGILGGLFGGGSSSESKTVGFGGSSSSFAIPGLVGATPGGLSGAIAGTGATANSALIPSASSALTSSTMADALPGLVGGTTSQLSSSGSATRTSSFAAGSPLLGLAAMGPALVGNFGGKLGQIGGLVSMLAIMGNSQILSGLAGGLIGFGVGQSHGGFLGALAGAGSGALTGFLAAGPVGAIIGGLVGLLGGIFGGIFGGAKRKRQANALADNTILPDITQIITGFDGFQIDQSSAIQQLEQLRSDAQKQLSALKSQGKDVFNQKVAPAIDSAEKHIRDMQSERDRRSSLVFGPPQFDTGGLFHTMRGNAGLAVLHDGEMVINPTATKKNAATLNAINQGKTIGRGGGDVHFNIYAMDAKSFDGWAKAGGAKRMATALTRYWDVEGNQ